MNAKLSPDTLKNIAIAYFYAFENKDLNKIEDYFAEQIVLRDWENEAKGLNNVMLIYRTIFESSAEIIVNIVNLYADGDFVIGELDILIDAMPSLKVVDIIEFTATGKISALRAYKG